MTNKPIKLVKCIKQYGLVFGKCVVDPVTKLSLPYGFMRMSEGEEDNVETLMNLWSSNGEEA